MTCLKLTVLMLLEFVLKEYFGGLGMEARTFIEEYLPLPTTRVETAHEVCFQITENPRSPRHAAWLRQAIQEINRREIRQNGKRMRFEIIAGPDG